VDFGGIMIEGILLTLAIIIAIGLFVVVYPMDGE
jgi:hypothetical protein